MVALGAPAAGHRAQRDHEPDGQHGVEPHDEHERDPDPVGLRDRVLRAHHLVDDPRLAPDLGDDPAALERDYRRHARDGDRAQEPLGLRDVALAPPRHAQPQREGGHPGADADHRVERPVQHRVGGRAILGRHGVEPDDLGVGAPPDQERVEPGDADPALDAVGRAAAVDVLRHVRGGRLDAFHRGELDRLVLGDRARGGVADEELHRRQDARDRERDQQPEAVVAVAPAPEHADGVNGGDHEAGDQVGREDHVRHLVGHGRVEDHLQRVDVGDLAIRHREALRLVHPGVDGHDRERAAETHERDRHARPEVRPRRQALPAEDVDRDEDRLEEEADPLDREQHTEDLAEAAGELRPQQPELEREHGPGHGADRERHRNDLRPAAGEQERVRIVAAQAAVVGDQHDRRERHPQRREDDVEPQRERHLAPRGIERRGREDGEIRHGAAVGSRSGAMSSSQWIDAASGRSRSCGPRAVVK